jgi:hypothetical protein
MALMARVMALFWPKACAASRGLVICTGTSGCTRSAPGV